MRRLRRTAKMRDMLAEVSISPAKMIAPVFVIDGDGPDEAIASLPGHFRYSVDSAVQYVSRLRDKGIGGVLLFGVCDRRDKTGSAAWDDDGGVQRLARVLRQRVGDIVIFTDVCLCAYTDHGHCGLLKDDGRGGMEVDNDATLELLGRAAVSHARAGADVVAPSAMMDGQVAAIRQALDTAVQDAAIMSYAVKYASSLYGPFRDAAGSSPALGDRRGYQMDFRTARQAIAEAAADVAEGADMLMVKPAATYLDVIAAVRDRFELPLAAYHVSGEYAMCRAAAERGWLELPEAAIEITTAIARAGADIIITYFAEELADHLTGS